MSIIEKIIKEYKNYELDALTKKMVEQFLNSDIKYVLGCNKQSESICKQLNVQYIIDDYTDKTEFMNAKIIKRFDVPENAVVVNTIIDSLTKTANKNLNNAGIYNIISYFDLCHYDNNRFEFPYFVLETRNELFDKKHIFEDIFKKLNDEESKKVLSDVLSYRIVADNKYLKNYKFIRKEQYFEDFIKLGDDEVFLDCGGFDGDTTEEFISRCPQFKKVYFFEPCLANMTKAKLRLNNNPKIDFIQKGVSDATETLYCTFNSAATTIADSGNEEVETVKIDDVISDIPTLIKMDLEGFEMKALEGCKNTIKNYKPKLAISVYHKPEDFCEIYTYIMSLNPNYKLYCRHYTEAMCDTDFFFV
ncbi:MAG: FkbM family methyltransferase [Candidatus Gastranaerophilales bacterium]|nr:FkbM family methyltransferase [Candidatus Gastranaerophilales bacterium]